ncbi:DUF7010 family protein [Knoellia subterranea]|uniref:Uncharacterized protein n=1 Tax=Knoellia subterranea KCTC 19937 TaxID=1385521 RepID=A0A0A0JP71_9MICO|nr:hypothetical protein [Knoellia subterranea]KGN37411.1 hypothetical protein N803_13480 [Knoellia subterranea KCTC 19937]
MASAAPIGSRMGALVFGIMGTIWWLAASNGLNGGAMFAFLVAGIVAGITTTVITARGTRNDGPMNAPQVTRTYNLVNLTQLVAIVVTVWACVRAGRQELIAPIVAAIVGVHFLPFRRLFQWSGYGVVGGLFVLVALVGLAVALTTGEVQMSLLVTGVGAALVLWGSAWALRQAQSTRPSLRA